MADFLNKPVIRFLLIGFLALPVQTTFFTDVKFSGVSVQLMLGLSVATGLVGGSEYGALAGFVFGLMFDLVLSSPLGLLAFVYGLAGWAAGSLYSRTVANPLWMNVLASGVFSGAGTFAVPIFANWVGVDGWISARLIKVVLVVAVGNMVLSVGTIPIMRWGLAIKRRERLSLSEDMFV